MELKRGTQIVYVPSHAEGDTKHRDAEQGFVTLAGESYAFCRYWSKFEGGQLRTKSCGELTPISHLVVQNSVPQIEVEAALKLWC